MLITKIMLNAKEEVHNLITQKAPSNQNRLSEAMMKIAESQRNSSIIQFNQIINDYREVLNNDLLIRNHIDKLYNTLLESNIIKILSVYERVELSYVSNKLQLNIDIITAKISQMILNNKINGVLDQAKGLVLLGEQSELTNDDLYNESLNLVDELTKTIDLIETWFPYR